MKTLAEMLGSFLKKCFPTKVTFDDGSYIEHLDREAILYAEKDGHRMEVAWYFKRGHIKRRILYADNINFWDSPNELEVLSEQKKKDIQRKIIEYCRIRNIPLEITPVGMKPINSK
jgi:hypothetical protein